MSHFPPWTRHALLIQMQTHAGDRQRTIEGWRSRTKPHVSKEVGDRRRLYETWIAQRQIAYRTHRLFELTGDAGTFARVIAVVRTRRKLVHQQPATLQQKHLDYQQTYDAKLLGNLQP